MTWRLGSVVVMGLGLLLTQASCGSAEREAVAAEREVLRETCALGDMNTVSRCGGDEASCHVCGRPSASLDVCLQPCTVGKVGECTTNQHCVPMDGLVGFARIGDCPSGYCE